jgi:hypothetical protein
MVVMAVMAVPATIVFFETFITETKGFELWADLK